MMIKKKQRYKDYDKVFGVFKYTSTPIEWFEHLKREIDESLAWPTVYRRKKWNQRIYEKWISVYNEFLDYVQEIGDTEEGLNEAVTWYHTTCLQDIELFALNYTVPKNGLPPFLAEWQVKVITKFIKTFKIAGLCSRKLGKSFSMAVAVLFFMVNGNIRGKVAREHHVRVFAPKKRQLFIRQDVNRIMRRMKFWNEEWILEDNTDKYHKGRFSIEHLEFGRTYSTFVGDGLAQTASKGRAATGEMGDTFICDEFGQILQESLGVAIIPMMADAYSLKRLGLIGTPTLDINPDLKSYWDSLVEDDSVFTFSYDWVYGVKTGCIPKEYMKMVAKGLIPGEENTYVPCPFMQQYGMCVKMLNDDTIRINENDNKLRYKDIDEDYEEAWSCDECCLLNKIFVEEYCADFAKADFRYWPIERLKSLADPSLQLYERPEWFDRKKENPELYVGIDFGSQAFPTEIILGEKIGRELWIRGYHQIPNVGKEEKKKVKDNMDPVLAECRDWLAPFQPWIKKMFIDVTGDKWKTLSVRVRKYFPSHKIFRNETSKEKGYMGIHYDIHYNNFMKKNLRDKIRVGWIHIPKREPFYSRFLWQMEHCKVEPKEGNLFSFKEPTSGGRRIDVLDAMSFISLAISSDARGSGSACNTIKINKRGGK